MLQNKFIQLFALVVFLSACASTAPVVSTDDRVPAGTGDIDSSTSGTGDAKMESYKLPITRNGLKSTKVAYNFWSGEWPGPVIDVKSEIKGNTTITGFSNLRNPTDADKVKCTIKNGLYHPWSTKQASAINYYTLTDISEYKAIKDFTHTITSYNGKDVKVKVPAGAIFTNVVYYGENLCGSLLTIGKNTRPFSEVCDFFTDNKDLQSLSTESKFTEQWIYLQCEEKDSSGKNIKAFIKDQDFLKQPQAKQGCPAEYGKVQGSKSCS